jgi:hypothetical protein
MKRFLSLVLVAVFIFALAGCGAEKSKKNIFNLVEKNYDAIVTACENKDEETLLAIDGISQVKIADGYVIVYCKGAGIAPSSQDYGFYYSEENSPVTVDCNLGIVCYAEGLSPEGDGYQCVVRGNTFYTEHIKGNMYFYSNAY